MLLNLNYLCYKIFKFNKKLSKKSLKSIKTIKLRCSVFSSFYFSRISRIFTNLFKTQLIIFISFNFIIKSALQTHF